MADHVNSRQWSFRGLFFLLCAIVIFGRLLPLESTTGTVPGPDLILLLACAWVLRRPSYVPALLVAIVMLLTDVLFLRPLGLWAAMAVLGIEFLRAREPFTRDLPFLAEWAMVSVAIIGVTLGNSLILAIFSVDQARPWLVLAQLIVTLATYPIVVLFSAKVLGLTKMSPGEVDQLGHRL